MARKNPSQTNRRLLEKKIPLQLFFDFWESLLELPRWKDFKQKKYDSNIFEPTTWDLENSQDKNPIPVVRFRKDPKTGALQSNSNIYKWSDGSVTLSVQGRKKLHVAMP